MQLTEMSVKIIWFLMDIYLKMVGITAIGILLCLILSKSANDYSYLITIVLCCGLCFASIELFTPIIHFLTDLGEWIGKTAPLLEILIKAVGLSLIGDMMANICMDAGHAAVGKTVQLSTTIAIIYISIPLIQSLFELIKSVLELI